MVDHGEAITAATGVIALSDGEAFVARAADGRIRAREPKTKEIA